MAAKIRSLQMWCKRQCEGYRDVEITNMTSSWKSGLAFCAVIHRYRPDLIDYDSLSKENVYDNCKLAFDMGQEHLNIPALLDAEDMVTMTVPDKLCIVTYVSQYYNVFSTMDPVGGPGVKQCRTTSKRTSTAATAAPVAKKITPTKPALSDHNAQETPQNGHANAAPARRNTYGDTCLICRRKVYLMERHIDEGKLYHRRCIRDQQKSIRSPTRPSNTPTAFEWPSADGRSEKSEYRVTKNTESLKSDTKEGDSKLVDKTKSRLDDVRKMDTTEMSKKSETVTSLIKTQTETTASDVRRPTAAQRGVISRNNDIGITISDIHSKQENRTALHSNGDIVKRSGNVSNVSDANENNNLLRPSANERGAAKKTNRPLSVSERALLFSNGPAPGEQKVVSRGVMGSSPTTKSQPVSYQVKSEPKVDVVTYTYHPGVVTTVGEQSIKSSLLSSLTNIRRSHSQDDSKFKQAMSIAEVHNSGTETVTTIEKRSFLGDESVLTTKQSTTKVNLNNNNPETCTVISSILKTRSSEGQSSQSTDLAGVKSILKPTSPWQSFDATAFKESTPKTILKSRLSDNSDSEDHPVPILKSRKSSDELEVVLGSPNNPRSILKTSSPPDSGRSRSTSPPKSILKSRESSPDNAPKPISILKSRESTEDLHCESFNDSRPKSILKNTHDEVPTFRDDRVSSPSRSILKHMSPHSAQDVRSVLKTGSEYTGSEENMETSRPDCQQVVTPPRAQIKVSPTHNPQPAPRTHHIQKQNTQHAESVSTRGNNPSKDLSAPKSILKPDATKMGQRPNEPSWGRSVPQAGISHGAPSISTSSSKRSAANTDNTRGNVNNFSAFNLVDSMLIHDNVAKVQPKGRSSPPIPAWQLEVEARKDFHHHDNKSKAPARPAAPVSVPKKSAVSVEKPTWQVEAERRKQERNGKYPDPEFRRVKEVPKKTDYAKNTDTKSLNEPTSNVKSPSSPPVRPPPPLRPPSYTAPVHEHPPSPQTNTPPPIPDRPPPSPQATMPAVPVRPPPSPQTTMPAIPERPPPSPQTTMPAVPERPPPSPHATTPPVPERPKVKYQYDKVWESSSNNDASRKGNLNRSPAFRIPTPESSPETTRSKTEQRAVLPESASQGKKKILPEGNFIFQSGDFDYHVEDSHDVSSNPVAPSGGDWIQRRPLPTPPLDERSPPKRMVNAEARVATLRIAKDLEDIDKCLCLLEEEGRAIEEKIRAGTDDDMDEDVLMVEWFEMINKKNDLVRRETELMYKRRQQELEDIHMDLEYELRLLMQKPEQMKTASDRVRENTLMQELLETVNLRNSIIDSMEEDRKRYIAEDKEIASMMAQSGLVPEQEELDKKKGKADKKKRYNPKHRKQFRMTIG